MKKIFTSNLGYKYSYSPTLNSILLTPSEIECVQNLSDSREGMEYYIEKNIFLNERGVFDNNISSRIYSEYNASYIESEMANLNQLLIEVTDECNLSCKYCSYGELYSNQDERNGGKQCFENVKILIDHLIDLWKSNKNISFGHIINIGFFGGEPLINMSLIKEIIGYLESIQIKGLKFVYNLTTNALLLGQYMDYLVEKEIHLLVSLDGSKVNNAYRVAKNGKESFDMIFFNVTKLKERYPRYFDSCVNFNAVLHNKNSLDEIYEFMKSSFGKTPYVSELNKNGIAEDKQEVFNKMFFSKSDSMKHSVNCGSRFLKEIDNDSKAVQLSIFMKSYLGNTYTTIPDLFFEEKNIRYYPTSTCTPFSKKIFLTVHGKILPCERVGQQYPLGYVKEGRLSLDFEDVKQFYKEMYDPIVDKCKECLLWKSCEICVFYLPKNEEGKTICPYFIGDVEINSYFSYYISALEEHPDLLERISNEILTD